MNSPHLCLMSYWHVLQMGYRIALYGVCRAYQTWMSALESRLREKKWVPFPHSRELLPRKYPGENSGGLKNSNPFIPSLPSYNSLMAAILALHSGHDGSRKRLFWSLSETDEYPARAPYVLLARSSNRYRITLSMVSAVRIKHGCRPGIKIAERKSG
ncbi:hypothetical protein CEXT_180691 [Caerostris extrusa]|uniref:Uncharacterized protein n=1 Tax=Caerostris extrusa TaxID=172846 RepID=A0AAV4Y5K2_CAEEX|nr:hypothetical protein CEXT_180691 [Caerostris extrusa]